MVLREKMFLPDTRRDKKDVFKRFCVEIFVAFCLTPVDAAPVDRLPDHPEDSPSLSLSLSPFSPISSFCSKLHVYAIEEKI